MEMFCGKIIKVAESERKIRYMERYRSGHNEAVLKTVCPQGRVGSNPTLSVQKGLCRCKVLLLYCAPDKSAVGISVFMDGTCQICHLNLVQI